jgi:hypothetical protein
MFEIQLVFRHLYSDKNMVDTETNLVMVGNFYHELKKLIYEKSYILSVRHGRYDKINLERMQRYHSLTVSDMKKNSCI